MKQFAQTKAPEEAPAAEPGSSPFLTADETAALLRTTRKAIYSLAERCLLPGARKFGRRLLIRRDLLLRAIEQTAINSER
jgi:excisionase family DNA binding protein